VIERHSKTPAVKTMLTVPCFTFHHVNAFETEGGQRIILDSIPWRSLDFSSNLENLGVRPSSGEALGWETLIVDFPSGWRRIRTRSASAVHIRCTQLRSSSREGRGSTTLTPSRGGGYIG
jgi:carotenoid cleavage dioxygenase-like enzyme